MQKTAFVLKIVAAGLLFGLGLTVFILGLSDNTGTYSISIWSDYERPLHNVYGGDAYTGIQNAAADTAINVAEVGNSLERFHNSMASQMQNIYIWSGVALMIVSIYLVGCALSTYQSKARQVQNDTPNFTSLNNF